MAATNALIDLIAGDLLPLSLIRSCFFKRFASILDSRYVVPSRKYLSTKLLTEKQQIIENRMKELLEKVDSVSITVDLWSNRLMKGFLGITCHFIFDWSLRSLILGCNRFRGEHNAENIAQNYEELISFYKLKGKVTHIVTDNASNMLKAFRLPGFSVLIADELDSEPSDEEDEVFSQWM